MLRQLGISDRPQHLESDLLKTLQSNLAALQNDFVEQKQKTDKTISEQDQKIFEQGQKITKLNDRNAEQDQKISEQDQKIKKQDHEGRELKDRTEEGEMMWGKIFVENVSSQVLLVAAGKQPDRRAKEPKYFRHMTPTHREQFTKLNAKYGFETIQDFSAAMDASILKRNNAVHYSRVRDLEEDVLRAKRLFERNARLKADCMIPFKTIVNFPRWKEEFASNFIF